MKKNIVLNVLATLCLSLVLVSAFPMNSIQQYEEYDPWMDVDDNGIINMIDLYEVALRYGTTGTAVNKTDLLLQLLSRVDSLNSTVMAQQEEIDDLRLELEILNSTKLGKPDYDSGWTPMPYAATNFYHGLGTTDLLAYVVGKADNDIYLLHQINYENWDRGVWWYCTNANSITLQRTSYDNLWDQVRILLWKIPEP